MECPLAGTLLEVIVAVEPEILGKLRKVSSAEHCKLGSFVALPSSDV